MNKIIDIFLEGAILLVEFILLVEWLTLGIASNALISTRNCTILSNININYSPHK